MKIFGVFFLIAFAVSAGLAQSAGLQYYGNRLPQLPSETNQIKPFYMQLDMLIENVDQEIAQCDQKIQQHILAVVQSGKSFQANSDGSLPPELIASIERARKDLEAGGVTYECAQKYLETYNDYMNNVIAPFAEARDYWEVHPDESPAMRKTMNETFNKKIERSLSKYFFASDAVFRGYYKERMDFMVQEYIPKEQCLANAEAQFFQNEGIRKCFVEKRGLVVLKEELELYKLNIFEMLGDGSKLYK